ncbi:MAG: dethiobiotin synthase, partial [Oscillospiraceae bacterium]|nr:dethiobiotin synthase [Oscillospiraceae bacterium]
SINSAVLTCHYARLMGINVRGFFLNRFDKSAPMQEDNRVMIERLSGAPVLGYVEENGDKLVLLRELSELF